MERLTDEEIISACGLLSINYRKIAQAQLESCEREAEGILEEMVDNCTFTILEWFRNYVRNLERKYPNPTVEEQGWLGNMWDMIHMAGKEEWANTTLKTELKKVKEEIELRLSSYLIMTWSEIPEWQAYWEGKGIE